ncbi:hypothetical protein GO013_06235 [Pseudodesulfovibrio sp. JC047]|uniref:hypothetical protein n=1 Tax=Pseudodesulfovibrio sp. JC047 TaxID=2683199 RepID=UPI0013D1009C|nr:hypothetical protein [Pseudodesulfovibrio sp. JC047]NDV19016.1 hypothetical protein [Pseudodesulfovibrio sp. JC047]
MKTQETVFSLTTLLTDLGQRLFPGIPDETIRYGEALVLALLAIILLLLGLVLLRRPKKKNSASRINIPRALREKGTVIDIMNGPDTNEISLRCVITAVKTNKITCEIIERIGPFTTDKNRKLFCVFAPIKTPKGTVNSFSTTLLKLGHSTRTANLMVLSVPTRYTMNSRRKHARKKVADQQFIRVKLWLEDPIFSDTSYQDAIPQIGVNSFSSENTAHNANGVVNISNGGVGLSITNSLIPNDCGPDSPVVINLFMFNFKEKAFKPYWYAGTIRSLEESRPGFTRMGIEFTATATPDPSTGRLNWANRSEE